MILEDLYTSLINCAKVDSWKVCVYGLGYLGKRISGRIAEILHLKIDFYCDGNPEAVDSFCLLGASAIYREELKEIKETVLVLILADYPNDDEIYKELADSQNLHLIRLRDMVSMDEVLRDFYGDDLYEAYVRIGRASDKRYRSVNKKESGSAKVAVYTCITGGYDELRNPDAVEEQCDYYVISDNADMMGKGYRYLDVDTVVPNPAMSPKDKNRYCKMHPHDIFPEYNYSIYLDGSIRIKRPISHYIKQVGFSGLGIHRHKIQDCVYIDGIFAEWLGVVKKDEIVRELKKYMEEGLPRRFGMFECGMIVTDLHNEIGQQICQRWFEEYRKGAKRDQFSLVYVLWKMGLTASAIGTLSSGYNILTNPDIIWDRKAHYV